MGREEEEESERAKVTLLQLYNIRNKFIPTRHIWPLTLFIKEVVPTLLRRYLESRANYDDLNGGRTYLSYLVRYLLDSTLDRTANLS